MDGTKLVKTPYPLAGASDVRGMVAVAVLNEDPYPFGVGGNDVIDDDEAVHGSALAGGVGAGAAAPYAAEVDTGRAGKDDDDDIIET
jgi:hypothetical protein